jgi:preprotein translocase SecF subunit
MYSELHCKTNYSFLTGGSHADELVNRAVQLGYRALAVTDENTLAGIVRAFGAVREATGNRSPGYPARRDGAQTHSGESDCEEVPKLQLIVGAEIIPNDSPPLVLWATNRRGYANLSRLITVGRRRASKGECWLTLADIGEYADGLLGGVIPSFKGERLRTEPMDSLHPSYAWYHREGNSNWAKSESLFLEKLGIYKEIFGDRVYLLASLYRGVDDRWRSEQLKQLSVNSGLSLVAAGDVLYHSPARLPLHDTLTAIKHCTTVASAGDLILPNAQRYLQTERDRCQAFSNIPGALERINEVVDRCDFCLSALRYEYPEELSPDGRPPIEYLTQLTRTGASERYPEGVPCRVEKQIDHELKLIDELKYEAYFLTVWDLVRFARGRGILCQGRGSAANSAVCFCLGVTAVDPETTELLFERFISKERDEAPDIDIDFEHERREEVLQYLYQKYGRERAGLAATVVTYRMRSAIRDVGKALGLSLDRVDALAKYVEGSRSKVDLSKKMQDVGMDPESEIGVRLIYLVNELLGFPRHLSQHVGGMVMTQGRLDEMVPIENASMDGRTVIQWDKDDLEELGILKVDCLCLGMLSAIRKCFHLVEQHWGRHCTLANVPQEDPRVYDMICAADTVGVFQIESRGQMSMLPRLKPRCWYDLVIEVAIVRPGPIQGNMVHPYLRRRSGNEPVVYPTPKTDPSNAEPEVTSPQEEETNEDDNQFKPETPTDNQIAKPESVTRSLKVTPGISGKSLINMLIEASETAELELEEEQIFVDSSDVEQDESAASTVSENWEVTMEVNRAEEADAIIDAWSQKLNQTPYFPTTSKVGGQIAGKTQVQALVAIFASLLGIIAYVWIRFQNVAFGLAAVIALIHDVLIVLGAIAISHWIAGALGFLGIVEFKISLEIIAALLTVIGYSLNDTIVVFDRIREVRGKRTEITADIVNASISQTLSRTILTSVTTFIVVFILYCFGGDAIHGFAFALVIGVLVGTYSSIFIASPALLWLMNTVGLNPGEVDPETA